MLMKRVVFWAYVAVFLGVFGNATSEFFSKLSGIKGPELSVWRYLLGAVSLVIVSLSSKTSRNLLQPVRENPIRVITLAIFGMTLAQFIFHISLDYATVIQVATIVTTMPILVVVVDAVVNKAKVPAPKVVSGVGAFFGVALLMTDGYLTQLKMGSDSLYGVVLAFFCALTAACYLVLVRPLVNQYGSIRMTTLTFVFGAVALWTTVGLVWGIWVDPTTLFDRPSQSYLSIMTLGVWNTCIAMILWLWGLSAVPDMSRANYLFFLKPVIAATLALLILGTQITSFQLLAIVIVLGCVVVEIFYDQLSGRVKSRLLGRLEEGPVAGGGKE